MFKVKCFISNWEQNKKLKKKILVARSLPPPLLKKRKELFCGSPYLRGVNVCGLEDAAAESPGQEQDDRQGGSVCRAVE